MDSVAVLKSIEANAYRLSYSVYVVGGVVRDLVIGESETNDYSDIDVVVVGDAIELARAVSAEIGCAIKEHLPFRTATLLLPNGTGIDLVTARKESYSKPGALPVVSPSTLEDDLARRDFSINALAMPVDSFCQLMSAIPDSGESVFEIVDLHDGWQDIECKVVRVLHEASFIDDPSRLFRCVRYASRYGFEIETETERCFHSAVEGRALTTISTVRMWNEVVKLLKERDPLKAIEMGITKGLFAESFPVRSDALACVARFGLYSTRINREDLNSSAILLAALIIPPEIRESSLQTFQIPKSIKKIVAEIEKGETKLDDPLPKLLADFSDKGTQEFRDVIARKIV